VYHGVGLADYVRVDWKRGEDVGLGCCFWMIEL